MFAIRECWIELSDMKVSSNKKAKCDLENGFDN
jgi:hypothetical protein